MQTFPNILIKTCAVSERILSHKKLLVSHKYGFFIIYCVVTPVAMCKTLFRLPKPNNACCSIIIGVLPLEIGHLIFFPSHFGSFLQLYSLLLVN